MWAFNPPPGWPVPPGFVPPAGWQPDPSWPVAPDGWEYWIPAPPPAGGAQPYAGGYPATAGYPSASYPVEPWSTAQQYAPPKVGMPGWGIATAIISVVVVLGVLAAVVVGAFGVALGSSFSEWDYSTADDYADGACITADHALRELPSAPDPTWASFVVRDLYSAIIDAAMASDANSTYDSLLVALRDARTAAEVVGNLPTLERPSVDQRSDAQAAWADLAEARSAVAAECRNVPATGSWGDSFGDTEAA
jgi:hypothetical protein